MTRSDHPSQTHLSSSIFCLLGGEGGESGSINSSSFSELMKLFGLHPYKPTPTYIFLEGGKQILTPTQTTPLPLLHFFLWYFLGWGEGEAWWG